MGVDPTSAHAPHGTPPGSRHVFRAGAGAVQRRHGDGLGRGEGHVTPPRRERVRTSIRGGEGRRRGRGRGERVGRRGGGFRGASAKSTTRPPVWPPVPSSPPRAVPSSAPSTGRRRNRGTRTTTSRRLRGPRVPFAESPRRRRRRALDALACPPTKFSPPRRFGRSSPPPLGAERRRSRFVCTDRTPGAPRQRRRGDRRLRRRRRGRSRGGVRGAHRGVLPRGRRGHGARGVR